MGKPRPSTLQVDLTAKSKRSPAAHLEPFKWQPGVSANPSGRPAMPHELRVMCRELSPECIQTLAEIMRTSDNGEHRIRAANSILARAYGMPAQEVRHSGELGISTLTTEEKAERLALLMQAAAAAGLLTAETLPALVDANPQDDTQDVVDVDTTTL